MQYLACAHNTYPARNPVASHREVTLLTDFNDCPAAGYYRCLSDPCQSVVCGKVGRLGPESTDVTSKKL